MDNSENLVEKYIQMIDDYHEALNKILNSGIIKDKLITYITKFIDSKGNMNYSNTLFIINNWRKIADNLK